jgi:transposase InsO family protein
MSISRSGYYKWLKNLEQLNSYEINRINLAEYIKKWHKKKPSYGYHRIAAKIKEETGWIISDNLVHKVCKLLKIVSSAKHYKYAKKEEKEEHKIYPKLVKSWNTSRPFEIVVSDGTVITFKGEKYDWNYYVDVFDDSIVGSNVCPYRYGMDLENHVLAFKDMINNKIKRGYKDLETIFHSDQGSIYTSTSFNDVCFNNNIIRSMSRAGTPTDNPIIESKNGWLKSEIQIDIDENDFNSIDEYIEFIINDNNYFRPAYSLKYKTPVQFRTEQGFT